MHIQGLMWFEWINLPPKQLTVRAYTPQVHAIKGCVYAALYGAASLTFGAGSKASIMTGFVQEYSSRKYERIKCSNLGFEKEDQLPLLHRWGTLHPITRPHLHDKCIRGRSWIPGHAWVTTSSEVTQAICLRKLNEIKDFQIMKLSRMHVHISHGQGTRVTAHHTCSRAINLTNSQELRPYERTVIFKTKFW